MSVTLTINANRSAFLDQEHPTTNYSSGTSADLYHGAGSPKYGRALLVGFPDTQLQAYPYRQILNARLKAYFLNAAGLMAYAYGFPIGEAWTENAVTWELRPDLNGSPMFPPPFYNTGYVSLLSGGSAGEIRQAVGNGVCLSGSISGYGLDGANIQVQTSRGTNPPQLIVELSDEDVVPAVNGSPSAGYVNKHQAITLAWALRQSAPTYAPITQTSATLYWREGAGGELHTVTGLGGSRTYTLPAETVAGSELRWMVEVTCSSGAVVSSPWYVCTTAEALSTAEIVSPKDTLLDGSSPAPLRWRHVISTGTAQTGADLQISEDGETWETVSSFFAGSSLLGFGVTAARLASHLFRCVVTDSSGNSRTSAVAQMRASAPPIVITAQPQDPIAALGDSATFSVAATGTGLSYQWQYLKPDETEWTDVTSAGGSTASYTVGTVAARHLTYVYRCRITDSSSNVLYTNEVRIVSETPPIVITAEPQDFVGAVGDLATFSISATGTGLRWLWQESPDGGVTWEDVASLVPAVSEAVLPADTLAAGTAYWSVRTYNTDGAAGAWSAGAQLAVVAGPAAPVVACTSNALPVISWQASGQQGFEAEIGGYSSGVVYGTEKQWEPPDFLPNGQATARVRVVNSYGLWSDWGELTVSIYNTGPGPNKSLDSYFGVNPYDVTLGWMTVGFSADEFWIYRDGERVAKTTETSYTDLDAVGTVSYKVRAVLGRGYIDANLPYVALTPKSAALLDLDAEARQWRELRYATEPVPTQQSNLSRPVAFLSVQGSALPIAEASAHRTRVFALTAAFTRDSGDADAVAAMLGHEVIYKDQYGSCLRGVMASIQVTRNRFYNVVSAQLQEVGGVL